MNDLISRKALCDYALNQKDKSVTPNDIMRFPSAQPERRWIPCSERLPKESGRYLVTNTQWGAYHVDWNIYYVNVEGHCDGWLWEQGCIAWMPFPEPYREERTEE